MEPRSHPHPESLLQHGLRLRALARSLVRDEHAADDLVQETWMRAVAHAPAAAPWRWLARVLRNLAVQERRLGAARARREHAAARGEAEPDPEQRFSGHKELVAAIDELPEPYRQAILLRFFEDLPPRRIAARLGIPVKTVKTRVSRALALLREELDRRHGGREAWMAAVLPLVDVPKGWGGKRWRGTPVRPSCSRVRSQPWRQASTSRFRPNRSRRSRSGSRGPPPLRRSPGGASPDGFS